MTASARGAFQRRVARTQKKHACLCTRPRTKFTRKKSERARGKIEEQERAFDALRAEMESSVAGMYSLQQMKDALGNKLAAADSVAEARAEENVD